MSVSSVSRCERLILTSLCVERAILDNRPWDVLLTPPVKRAGRGDWHVLGVEYVLVCLANRNKVEYALNSVSKGVGRQKSKHTSKHAQYKIGAIIQYTITSAPKTLSSAQTAKETRQLSFISRAKNRAARKSSGLECAGSLGCLSPPIMIDPVWPLMPFPICPSSEPENSTRSI
jgi:hypothetical protein